MYLFLSYRDTPRAAEAEFMKLVGDAGRAIRRRSPLAGTSPDGWSRLLPGLVCDLEPDMTGEKSPAMFIGMLSEKLLVSCRLLASPSQLKESAIRKLLRERHRDYDITSASHGYLQVRRDVFMQIADGSISVTRIVGHPVLSNQLSAYAGAAGAPTQDATTASILELASQIAGSAASKQHLSTLAALLLDGFSGGGSKTTLRKLAREYNCRFAWTSIRLSNITRDEMGWSDPLPALSAFSPAEMEEDAKSGSWALRSFWEAGGSLLWPSSFSYSPFVGPGPRRSWPPWLRFLVFVTNAGMQAGPKRWAAEFPTMLRGRKRARRKGAAPNRKRGGGGGASSGALLTLLDLFRGSSSPLRVRHGARRRALRGADRKALLLKIERALYIPDTDTILSLYRGDPCPVGAFTRRRRERR